MPVSCEPEDLAEAAACFAVGYDSDVLQAIRVYLLCATINGDTVDCDVETLAEAATCFVASLSKGQLDAVETYLVCLLNSGGTGGGTTQVYTGAAPPAAPDDPTKPALFYPTGGGSISQWDGAAWV